MGFVLATFKFMPETVDTDLDNVKNEVEDVISKFGAKTEKVDREPVAFGLNALIVVVSIDENKGGLDPLEDQLRNVEGVESVEVTDVRRAIG
ncbi:MAG: elongation factor 1-beta [Nanoarchaeota archaeon]